jgi:hypothetical protein
MRIQKLLISAATSCFLVGASGAAVAADCAAGVINNRTVNNLKVTGTNCYVSETIVKGNVTVTDSPNFAMINNRVLGKITITGGGAVLLKDNELFDDRIRVDGTGIVWIFSNRLQGDPTTSNMVLKNSADEVEIFNNTVDGNLVCENNSFQLASGNAVGGTNTCISQNP